MAKLFLSIGETASQLGLSRSQLQPIFPYLLHLYISARQTRLFSLSYVGAYTRYLQEVGKAATIETAKDFVQTDRAKRLIKKVQAALKSSLDSKPHFTIPEVAKLFCVGRMTITNWHQAGIFIPTRQIIEPKRDRGKGERGILLFSQDELHRIGEWKIGRT